MSENALENRRHVNIVLRTSQNLCWADNRTHFVRNSMSPKNSISNLGENPAMRCEYSGELLYLVNLRTSLFLVLKRYKSSFVRLLYVPDGNKNR